jgi:hypothetical protein
VDGSPARRESASVTNCGSLNMALVMSVGDPQADVSYSTCGTCCQDDHAAYCY